MRVLQKFGAATMVAGFLVTLAGGISVKRGPDGTWFQLNLVHEIGIGLLLFGMIFVIIAAFAGGASSADPDTPANRGDNG